jgi:hypothetical protein
MRADKRYRKHFAILLSIALTLATNSAVPQTPKPPDIPTVRVVKQYLRLVARREFLSPGGWARAGKLFEATGPYPADSEISLMNTGGLVGEDWVKGDTAQVETKWTDYLGSIGSNLQYKPAQFDCMVTIYTYLLTYTNKHRDLTADGSVKRETTGPPEWKMQGPEKIRWATPRRALEYVQAKHDQSTDPVIRKNAEKTIAALKRIAGT